MVAARSMAKNAKRLHEANLNALEATQVPLHARIVEYGEQQLAAVTDTIGRFAEWIERNQMSVNRLAHETVDGVKVDVPDLPQMKSEVKMARKLDPWWGCGRHRRGGSTLRRADGRISFGDREHWGCDLGSDWCRAEERHAGLAWWRLTRRRW